MTTDSAIDADAPSPSKTSTVQPRYVLICVAPEQPYGGEFDDPDEAVVATDSYWGSHYDVFDRKTGKYVSSHYPEDIEDARQRLAEKAAA